MQGDCRFGDRCNFAHGEHELRQEPAGGPGRGFGSPGRGSFNGAGRGFGPGRGGYGAGRGYGPGRVSPVTSVLFCQHFSCVLLSALRLYFLCLYFLCLL